MRIVVIRGSSQRMVRKMSDKINGFINKGLYESFLLTCSMFKSRILQVFTVFLVDGNSRVQLLARRSGLPRIKSYSLALTTAVQAYPES